MLESSASKWRKDLAACLQQRPLIERELEQKVCFSFRMHNHLRCPGKDKHGTFVDRVREVLESVVSLEDFLDLIPTHDVLIDSVTFIVDPCH